MSEFKRQIYFTLPTLKDTKNYLATPSVLQDGPNAADVIIEKTYVCPVNQGDRILTLEDIIAAQQDVTILDPKYSTRPIEPEDFHKKVETGAQRFARLLPNRVKQLVLERISRNKMNEATTRRLVDFLQMMDSEEKMAVCAANYNLAVADPTSKYANTRIGKVVEEIYDAGTYDVEQCGTCVLKDAKNGIATRSCGTIFKARGVIGAPGKTS